MARDFLQYARKCTGGYRLEWGEYDEDSGHQACRDKCMGRADCQGGQLWGGEAWSVSFSMQLGLNFMF